MFIVVELTPAGERPAPMLGGTVFDSGLDASRMSERLRSLYGGKYQPRPMKDLPDWRPREAQRLLRKFPQGWDLAPIIDHFAEPVTDPHDRTVISYVASDRDGYMKKRTELTVGRYLSRYYPDLPDSEMRRLLGLIDPPIEVMFATTAKEIEHVYVTGPSSCMSYEKREEWYGFPCHPVTAYAAGDLAVAYIKNRRGGISARAICWPDRKLYGRLYGDEERLGQALDALGYRKAKDFVGARVAKIPHKSKRLGRVGFVMPYFDNLFALEDKGDHFISVESKTDLPRIVIDGGTTGLGGFAKRCPKMNQFFGEEDFVHVTDVDEDWSQLAISHGFAFRCEGNGQYWSDNEMVRLDQPYARWSQIHFAMHGFTCALSGWKCANTEKVVQDGKDCSKTYIEQHAMKSRQSNYSGLFSSKGVLIDSLDSMDDHYYWNGPIPVG